jgi:Carbohydrate-binding module family 5/12
MTHQELEALAAGLAPVIKEMFAQRDAHHEALKADVEKLKSDLAALDAKALKGGATWARGVAYAKNDCVQHAGGLWRCCEDHVSGATFSHECFLLQVKSGRDGKDAR